VSRLARALADVFDAAKMNYELLGNELPHVHWHLVPRGADDPAPRRPVWTVAHEPRRLPPEDLAARIASIARRLER